MQLCPNSTWQGGSVSALHAMALLQVHRVKALRNLHEGGHDPQVLQELRRQRLRRDQ